MAAMNVWRVLYKKVFQLPHTIILSDPQNNPRIRQELVSGDIEFHPGSQHNVTNLDPELECSNSRSQSK